MKFFVISDNVDTAIGLRLAGMEGIVVHTKEETEKALTEVINNSEIGIVLMTTKLISLCPEMIYDIKLNRRRPLLSEIPDRHGSTNIGDTISQYVREAIGIQF